MLRKYFFIIFAVTCFEQISINGASPGKLPFDKCSLKDSECIKTQVQKSVSAFTAGIPELGIQKLDKMFIDSVKIQKDGLDFQIRNVEIEGLRNAVIDNVWIDTNLKYIHLTFHTNLNIDSDYTVGGHLFTFPVSGAGKAHMRKFNDTTEMLILFDFKKNENGEDVINLLDYRYGNDKSGADYRFENLFNGDKAKSDLVHEFINRNWRTTTLSFGPYLYDKMNDILFNSCKSILGSAPVQDFAIVD
ncbi:circadian clock-controlled protein daywake [Bicyclus anynana]|uniref:Circadian clock-controlled protein daywake n=1 Tax=Bicyclus anynana TaxID=110368 RepID=A0A6J1MG71_BICAN|nr:circadian clock-controlled protein daywake [Bicyclus anynana]